MTFEMIDKLHGRPDGTAGRQFRSVRDRLLLGADFIEVGSDEIRRDLAEGTFAKFTPKGFLITRRGYLKLVKGFNDDRAWAVMEEMVDRYFVVEQIQNAVASNDIEGVVSILSDIVRDVGAGHAARNYCGERHRAASMICAFVVGYPRSIAMRGPNLPSKMVDDMEGQWLGFMQGTNKGSVLLDVDDCGDHYSGTGSVMEETPGLDRFGYCASFKTIDKACTQVVDVYPQIIDRATGQLIGQDEAHQKLGLAKPGTVKLLFYRKTESLRVIWNTEANTRGTVDLPVSRASKASEYRPSGSVKTWAEFREYVLGLPSRRYIFRGQSRPSRLRTAFHRTNRKDLWRFVNQDIPEVHRALIGRTRHIFNLRDEQQNGAFWNLIQHHGYPTPLLDWSWSPMVAAFFAYQPERMARAPDSTVRIFKFDTARWTKMPQYEIAAAHCPHFSLLLPLAIENPRAGPQQALSTVTNVDDIETYIRHVEAGNSDNYLEVFDLPLSEQNLVLRELAMGGVTHGSMFPGLDGVCAELRARNFRYTIPET